VVELTLRRKYPVEWIAMRLGMVAGPESVSVINGKVLETICQNQFCETTDCIRSATELADAMLGGHQAYCSSPFIGRLFSGKIGAPVGLQTVCSPI